MDRSHAPSIQSLAAFYPAGYAPIMPPHPDVYHPQFAQPRGLSAENLISPVEYGTPARSMSLPQEGSRQRQRRRQSHGADHIKHRRTRSGCYTCRQRRVKCDETHPVCERCRKGSRECVYPSAVTSSKPERRASRTKASPDERESSPSGDESEQGSRQALTTVVDDEDDLGSEAGSDSDNSNPIDLSPDGGRASVDSASGRISLSSRSVQSAQSRRASLQKKLSGASSSSRRSALPNDVKSSLIYRKEHMTHHHYGFELDRGNFMETTLVELGRKDESQALLYAIVAFAAYHHTVAQDNLKLSPFLSYYNKSIMLLQHSLKTKKPDVTTLLTILQLATIEEFLGDWVNLIGHQRAAFHILTDLFNPETIMQGPTERRIFHWFMRFDLFAGIMSGGETTLGWEWVASCHEYYKRQAEEMPDDVGAKMDALFATHRLLATDVTLVIAAKGQNTISDQEFVDKVHDLDTRLKAYGNDLETAFTDPSYFVKEFPRTPGPTDEPITEYQDPNFVYKGDLFGMNYVLMNYWAITLMFKYQVSLALRRPPTDDLTALALKKCKMFEGIEYCEEGHDSAILGCQASLAVASLFLPKEEKYIMWCRKKYVLIEQGGYIYPTTLRGRMSELWGVDVTQWWLPNDQDYPRTIQAIREFIDYRARIPQDAMAVHVRDMSGIFRNLSVEDMEMTGISISRSDTMDDVSPTS